MQERRQYVRVRPLMELPAALTLVPPEAEGTIHVVDVSLGGVGVWVQGRAPLAVGARLRVVLTLGAGPALELEAEVRYARPPDGAYCGLQFVAPDEDARHRLGRYVSELVTRGSVS